MSAADRRVASEAICTKLTDDVAQRRAVAFFAATDNEVEVFALARRASTAGVALFFPKVTGPGQMTFRRVDQVDELKPGAFGILEPPGDVEADPGEIGLVLVPAIAFDRLGNRLGFGGGYYDRRLAAMREENPALEIVGVGYSWQVLQEPLPTAEWDVPMDRVVTDRI